MSYIHIPKWSQSHNGAYIPLFQSQKNQKNPILFIGGVHGDEPEGVALAEGLLEWLKNNTSEQIKPWALIPCLNPDGFHLKQRGNGKGVDLNRNYPSKNWAPLNPKTPKRYYPGPSPGSEPETQSLVQLIHSLQPEVILHFHSWNPCIVLTGTTHKKYAQYLSDSSGYKIVDDIGYPTPGSLSQFGWHDLKIPIICIEEQEHTELKEVWPRFKKGLLQILKS